MNENDLQPNGNYFPTRPLPPVPNIGHVIRNCSFCDFSGAYEDFPDDSIFFLGIAACADCLKSGKTSEFKEILTVK